MKIKTIPKLYKKFPEVDELLEEGYFITFEGQPEPYDNENKPWYCSLYYGDSNSPWKVGTIQGFGEGYTQSGAYFNAVRNLNEVI